MAWEPLPVDYTDADWSGLKKYKEITNDDGTVSFQDVTQYSNHEKSFFGAKDANRMDEALNTLMNMVENGTDLYEAFQNYFDEQKSDFKKEADSKQSDFTAYVDGLKKDGDDAISTIKTDYREEITTYEAQQEQIFNAWFQAMQNQLSQDAAGQLANITTDLTERLANVEEMYRQNEWYTPLIIDDEGHTLLVDNMNDVLLADWRNKEV